MELNGDEVVVAAVLHGGFLAHREHLRNEAALHDGAHLRGVHLSFFFFQKRRTDARGGRKRREEAVFRVRVESSVVVSRRVSLFLGASQCGIA
jgi:hypothetical protein